MNQSPPTSHSRWNRRGAILILVLGMVAVLSIVAVEMSHSAKLDSGRASRMQRDFAFQRAFDSGLHAAIGLIVEGRKQLDFDYLGDAWNRPLTLTLNPGETVSVKVSDESGKYKLPSSLSNGNGDSASRELQLAALTRLFGAQIQAEPEREADWVACKQALLKRLALDKAPDTQNIQAAVTQPVALLTLDSLRENGLALSTVLGVGIKKESAALTSLYDLFTLVGDGKVNLNTASPAVLASVHPDFTQEVLNGIQMWRNDDAKNSSISKAEKGALPAFKATKDLEMVKGVVRTEVVDGKTRQVSLLEKTGATLSVKSSAFSALIEATINGRTRYAIAYFEILATQPGNTKPALNGDLQVVSFEELEP